MKNCWISWDSDIKECPHLPSMGGWFGFKNDDVGAAISGQKFPHRWKDYINGLSEEAVLCAESVRDLMLERWPDSLPPGGFWHQGQGGEEDTVPIAFCGGHVSMSMRAWGDIVAAVISERDNKDYSYIDFAWNLKD